MKHLAIILLVASGLFSSCDPGLNGALRVYNQANLPLTIVAFNYGSKDSATFIVEPNTSAAIKILGGLGNQKTFDCCPCEYEKIYITTTNGNIKKDPANKDNWVIPNKDKQKKFGGEDLKCEFYVHQSDI